MTPRGYLTPQQYGALTGVDISDGDATLKLLSAAEAIVDGYLGTWRPAVGHLQGVAAAASTEGMTLAPEHQNLASVDLLRGCIVEFVSGDAAGYYTNIANSDRLGHVGYQTALPVEPLAGDVYHIYQMGKIPRLGQADLISVLQPDGNQRTVRQIPPALREAVAAQALYITEMGADYFNGNAMNMDSESFGSYSYTKSAGSKGTGSMIAPKAKQALMGSGLINRTGVIVGY